MATPADDVQEPLPTPGRSPVDGLLRARLRHRRRLRDPALRGLRPGLHRPSPAALRDGALLPRRLLRRRGGEALRRTGGGDAAGPLRLAGASRRGGGGRRPGSRARRGVRPRLPARRLPPARLDRGGDGDVARVLGPRPRGPGHPGPRRDPRVPGPPRRFLRRGHPLARARARDRPRIAPGRDRAALAAGRRAARERPQLREPRGAPHRARVVPPRRASPPGPLHARRRSPACWTWPGSRASSPASSRPSSTPSASSSRR